ncbi:MAG: tRNA (N6-threonylcarbamoyladenosine(37)-N6)-methyltransferase TrmO, partial [Chloroflexota bacterium]
MCSAMEWASESGAGGVAPDMRLRPVGIVRSPLKQPSLVPQSGDLHWGAGVERAHQERGAIAELVIDEGLTGIIDGIDGFSHILVLYWAHLVPQEARSMTKVHPMGRRDLPLTGIFATCSPARPNPISVTAVRLLERTGNVLVVEGLEAVDGSPLIDIKPYTPYY